MCRKKTRTSIRASVDWDALFAHFPLLSMRKIPQTHCFCMLVINCQLCSHLVQPQIMNGWYIVNFILTFSVRLNETNVEKLELINVCVWRNCGGENVLELKHLHVILFYISYFIFSLFARSIRVNGPTSKFTSKNGNI